MSDFLQAETDRARALRQSEHRSELRKLAPKVGAMSEYIAGLSHVQDRRLALDAAQEIAPNLSEQVEREVRWIFDRRKASR